jgi:hypothetical protein
VHHRVSVVRDRGLRWLVPVVLGVLGVMLYWPVFGIRPLRGDNFYVLAWVDAASFADLWRLDPEIYPEWRPLAYQSIWLEHQLVQLRAVAIHHGVNLALWIACAWLVYRIVVRLSDSHLAGALAAVLLASDPRAMPLMTWIVDRQGSMACVFGLLALDVAVRARDRDLTRREGVIVSICLLCSALSKEYGLAFTAAFLAYAGWRRNPDLRWPAAAAASYLALRMVVAGGAFGVYCEDMGFLNEVDRKCIDPSGTANWRQMSYNVAVSAIAIPVRGVFDEMGALSVGRRTLLPTAALALVSILGLVRGHPVNRLVALVIVSNALLGFMVYRPRNMVAGQCAQAILTGVGIALVLRSGAASRPRLAMAAAAGALTAIVLGQQVRATQARVAGEVASLQDADPCDSAVRKRPFGERFVEKVKRRFEMSDPDCTATR